MPPAVRYLSRFDVRRYHDRATNSVCLQYTGSSLKFHDAIYGFPDGVFFVASVDEMPYPPKLIETSQSTGIPIEATNVARALKVAAVDALVAEAMVKAPAMLAEFASPVTQWAAWDHRELERRHVIAVSKLVELTSLCDRELHLRATKVMVDPGLPHIPSFTTMPSAFAHAAPTIMPPPPAPEPEPAGQPTKALLDRTKKAVLVAREAELPQRLPQGARRGLAKLVRSAYLICSEDAPSVRADLAEAMQDAEKISASENVEVTVVDWDGEWPVVVRRYAAGRTTYRVEDALRRAGVEERAA